jgi:hypothetical protein
MAALGTGGPMLAYADSFAPADSALGYADAKKPAFPIKAPLAAPAQTPDLTFWAQGVGAWGKIATAMPPMSAATSPAFSQASIAASASGACPHRAEGRINSRGSNRYWMKVQWQVMRAQLMRRVRHGTTSEIHRVF